MVSAFKSSPGNRYLHKSVPETSLEFTIFFVMQRTEAAQTTLLPDDAFSSCALILAQPELYASNISTIFARKSFIGHWQVPALR